MKGQGEMQSDSHVDDAHSLWLRGIRKGRYNRSS